MTDKELTPLVEFLERVLVKYADKINIDELPDIETVDD